MEEWEGSIGDCRVLVSPRYCIRIPIFGCSWFSTESDWTLLPYYKSLDSVCRAMILSFKSTYLSFNLIKSPQFGNWKHHSFPRRPHSWVLDVCRHNRYNRAQNPSDLWLLDLDCHLQHFWLRVKDNLSRRPRCTRLPREFFLKFRSQHHNLHCSRRGLPHPVSVHRSWY